MSLKELQEVIDQWIKNYGVRYYNESTNMMILMEEVGELSRYMARKYGEQSSKRMLSGDELREGIADELGDILFVLTCLSNQMDLSLEEIMIKNLMKKTQRDAQRHVNNDKL